MLYAVITYNGKVSEKECIDRYTFLSHIAVYVKLTQHCKLTILQFFKKMKKKYPEPAHFCYRLHFFPLLSQCHHFSLELLQDFGVNHTESQVDSLFSNGGGRS